MATLTKETIKSALMGAAVADAFGVPFEFLPPETAGKYSLNIMHGCDCDPIREQRRDDLPAGTWSDDTSMAIATMESVIRQGGELDLTDVMNQFVAWVNDSKYCALDYVFDVGRTVLRAIRRFYSGTPALESGGNQLKDNGNGSLMRIFPITLLAFSKGVHRTERYELICQASSLTHAHPISKFSCVFFDELLHQILDNQPLQKAFEKAQGVPYERYLPAENWAEALEVHSRILSPDFATVKPEEINSSGYVVDTLEIAIYSLLHSSSYAETIQTTVKFGYDTDTYATIAGAAAGAIYGGKEIPENWLNALKKREYLEDAASRFAEAIS